MGIPLTPLASPDIQNEIRNSVLYHITKRENIASIVGTSEKSESILGLRDVNLITKSKTRHEIWLMFRDITIFDPEPDPTRPGYTYFFLGEPKTWLQTGNLDWRLWRSLKTDYEAIRIKGSDAVKSANGRVFYRALDRIVAIRGGYAGPAFIGWDH
jgi:hypothetical protein